MNRRRLKVRDDNAEYIIYHPIPCLHLPPIGKDISDAGCQTVSIDPAIRNFAIRIERRFRSGYAEPIFFSKVDLSIYGDVSESGTTGIEPKIFIALNQLLTSLLPILVDSEIIGIERQMGINYKSTRIFQHLLTFFLLHITGFKKYCILMDISSKLKSKYLGAPKGMTTLALKQWGIEKAIEILTWRNDQASLNIIRQHRGRAKTKADDLADTVIQMEAWFILNKGANTEETKPLLIG